MAFTSSRRPRHRGTLIGFVTWLSSLATACGAPPTTEDASHDGDVVVSDESIPDAIVTYDVGEDVPVVVDVPPPDPCAMHTCTPHATCHVVDGAAACDCDAGYLPWQSACSPDTDHDGLSDDEEFAFASEVAPVLVFDVDETYSERRTYWAVAPTGGGGHSAYFAHGYYQDGGSTFGITSHLGDSEFIVVTRTAGSQTFLFLSAHYMASTDASAWFPLAAFETTTWTDGHTRPLVFVAYRKHGNYPDLASCDAGALHTDSCSRGAMEIVPVFAERNLGQSWAPVIDNVALDMPDRRIEYFWTDVRFCGWQVPGDSTADRSGCAPDANSYARQMGAWESGRL